MVTISSLKKSVKAGTPARQVRIAEPESPPCGKESYAAFAISRRSPTPFPHRPSAKQQTVGKRRIPFSLWKRRHTSRQVCPPQEKQSRPAKPSDSDKENGGEGSPTYNGFAKSARYVRRMIYKPGDCVLVKVWLKGRYTWRHGIIADFEVFAPRPKITTSRGYPSSYAVTYLEGGEAETEYFVPAKCGILYDTVFSAAARRVAEIYPQ